jgi:hypothetical protein
MSGHPPFGAQVILNGHEYVACQARRTGIGFSKQENCFTTIANTADLAKVADTLSAQPTAGRLRQLCERWIYTVCLCFGLDLEEQKRSGFRYEYSVYQMEYSPNLLFASDRQMEQIFRALIDRTRGPLDLDRIKTIFGDKKRPHYDKRKKTPTRWGVVVETPAYDVTIFKVHCGKMTLKIYTKGERVLRIEVIVHNTREHRWGLLAALLPGDRRPPRQHPGEIPGRGRLHGRLLRQRRHSGKPAAAGPGGPDHSGRNRSEQAPDAPGSRGDSGVVDIS